MTQSAAECVVCHQPLPVGEPVAFMDKGRLIHVSCYRALPPSGATSAGARRRDGRARSGRVSRVTRSTNPAVA